MSRVLIAGCGYVGSALATMLRDEGQEVFGLRRSDGALPSGVTRVRADLTRPQSLEVLPDRIDRVVYVVGADRSDEDAYRAAYVDGLRNLIAAFSRRPNGPQRLLVTTSTAVYAQDAGERVDERSPTSPTAFQGRILLECESLARTSGILATAVRFGGIYGPGRTRLIEEVRRGKATIPDRPSYTNRIHRDDCARVLQHLLFHANPESVYVGVDTEPADRREVIRWLADRLNAPAPRIVALPGPPSRGKRCDSTLLRRSGYQFSYPTFREGYADVLAACGDGREHR